MLMRLSVLVVGLGLAAMTVPQIASKYVENAGKSDVTPEMPVEQALAPAHGSTILAAGQYGHFFGTFLINGRKQEGLVDTGASAVALNVSMARRLGLSPSSLQFDVRVDTANGVVKGARVTLDRFAIGNVSVNDVTALVLPDKSLSGMLVGMSFLGKLSSYRVEDGALYLVR